MADGGAAARAAVHDALRQRGFTPAAPEAGASLYAGILDPDALGIPITIAVEDLDFVAYPCIRIEPGFVMPARTLPHVAGLDRSLCYYAKGSVILDRYDPGGTVLQCIAQAETVLRDAVAGRSNDDLADEFHAYWGSSYVYVDLPRDHIGPARLCLTALDRGDKTPLVATTGRSWFMARGERTRRQADAGEPLMVIAVDRPLTFAATEAWPPKALPDLDRWLARAAPDLAGVVQRTLRMGTGTSAAVLIRAPNGMYCYRIKVPPHLRRPEFLRNRRTRLPEIMKRQPTATPVERFVGHRADTDYLFGRNLGGMLNLAGKRILLVGCGTIGGFLAQQLAQCGAGAGRGSLTLVDPDVLKPGNIGRHLLGVPYLGENKAEACVAFLKAQLPPLAIAGRAGDVLALDLRRERYDLVVDATGEEALSLALNERAVRARPGGPPHLFVWLAGNGAAAQCLLTGEAGRACLKCLKPALAGPPRFPVLRPGVDVETVINVSCSDPDYIPFPVSRSVAAAALACEVVLDWANGDPGDRFRSLILDARSALPVPSGSPSPVEACPACGPAA
ncbi:dinucleotide-utilizing enzymes [Methylobacterium aquaticum]|uniref:Dinucleotide-utilizing enzymes n=1 Tax=Methylobacterium aquaticum TaxID=270351 RepID=A0A0C6FLJ0_9HYPH|nr:dinucleotide-utilizing enzymes [Methylobacterium aquaticum]